MSGADIWEQVIEGYIEKGMTRTQAVAAVAKKNPIIHAKFVAEANQRAGFAHAARIWFQHLAQMTS